MLKIKLKSALLGVLLTLLAPILAWCATTTSRLGLTIPAFGDQNWDVQLRSDFNIIDSSVVINSTTSVINSVTNFGAVGDGITDNTNAFNSIIAVSSYVYIPCGRYIISPISIVNRSSITIEGQGACSTLIQKTSTNSALITISTGTDIVLKDFQIDGNGANQTADSSVGVLVVGSTRTVVQNLTIKNTTGSGIEFLAWTPQSCYQDSILDNNIHDLLGTTGKGIYVIGGGTAFHCDQMIIRGNHVNNPPAEAAQIFTHNSIIADNDFRNMNNEGVTFTNGGNNVITGNHIISAGTAAEFGCNTNGNLFTGNYVENPLTGLSGGSAISFTCTSVGDFHITGTNTSSRMTISGNTIISGNSMLQYSTTDYASMAELTITGNTFYKSSATDTTDWIRADVTNSNISNNIFDASTMTVSNNILTWSSMQNTVITNNQFMGSTKATMVAFNSLTGSGKFNYITGNNKLGGAFAADGFDSTDMVITSSGVFGFTHSSAAVAGYVGELIISSNTNEPSWTTTSGNIGDVTSIVLTAGDWDIDALTGIDANGGSPTNFSTWISTISGNSSVGQFLGVNGLLAIPGTGIISALHLAIPPMRVAVNTSTTFYLKQRAIWTVSAPLTYGYRLQARRAR